MKIQGALFRKPSLAVPTIGIQSSQLESSALASIKFGQKQDQIELRQPPPQIPREGYKPLKIRSWFPVGLMNSGMIGNNIAAPCNPAAVEDGNGSPHLGMSIVHFGNSKEYSSTPKVVTIVGVRPQFIKAAVLSRALEQAGITEVLVHTGQHYDPKMSDVFFDQLEIPKPGINLGIGSSSANAQLAKVMMELEPFLQKEKPDAVIVFGDTNATLAGAITAANLNIPVVHVEAGMRNGNMAMPEERIRIMVDHISSLLFPSADFATKNLLSEGIPKEKIVRTSDLTKDAFDLFLPKAKTEYSHLLEDYGLKPGEYYLLTMHRAETKANPSDTRKLLQALDRQNVPVIFPLHPGMRDIVESAGPFRNIKCIDPASYLEMLALESSAKAILTDSAGIEKEAAFVGVPCITLRNETEWIETVTSGWNQLVGLSASQLLQALRHIKIPDESSQVLYENQPAKDLMVDSIFDLISEHQAEKNT